MFWTRLAAAFSICFPIHTSLPFTCQSLTLPRSIRRHHLCSPYVPLSTRQRCPARHSVPYLLTPTLCGHPGRAFFCALMLTPTEGTQRPEPMETKNKKETKKKQKTSCPSHSSIGMIVAVSFHHLKYWLPNFKLLIRILQLTKQILAKM